MRTILLLLVLSTVGWGQTDALDRETEPTLFLQHLVRLDTAQFYNKSTMFHDILDEWKLYEQECYTDSFRVWTMPQSASAIQGAKEWEDTTKMPQTTYYETLIARYPSLQWTHREPSFLGFMEYLERKYGK